MTEITREYVLQLEEGEEMDTLVATRIMKWHLASNKHGWKFWEDEEGHFAEGMQQEYVDSDGIMNYEDEEDFHTLHWHPSSSWLWMEEVVEKLNESQNEITGYFFDLQHPGLYSQEEMNWVATFGTILATAPTAPLAVCRAALLTTL